MRFKLLLIFFLISAGCYENLHAQGFNEYYAVYNEGYNNKDLAKMKQGSELLMKNLPDEFAGHYLNSFYLLCAGNADQAQIQINKALNIEPLSPYPYMAQAYIHFVNNKVDLAVKNLTYAVQLRSHPTYDDIYKDLNLLASFSNKDFSTLKNTLNQLTEQGVKNPSLAQKFDECFSGTMKGKACNDLDELAAKFNAMPNANPNIMKMLPLAKAVKFYSNGNIAASKTQFETFLRVTEDDPLMYWKRSYANWFLSILKKNSFDDRGAFLSVNTALQESIKLGFSSAQLANILLHKIHVLKDLGDRQQEKLEAAFQLEQTANTLNNNYYRAKAYNSIGAYYLMNGAQAEISKGGEYLTKAYNLAKTVKDVPLTREVNGNYIVIKAKQGLYAEVEKITEETAQGYIKDKLYNDAHNLYNNLGFIYYKNKNYTGAITQFEKSIALADQMKEGLNAKQKLTYTNRIAGVYTGLAMSYKHSNEVEKLFSVQEQSRSVYLKDLLRTNTPNATIQDAQQLLKNDELLLTYTIGRPGEIILTAITKNKAEIRYNYPIDELLRFKKKYTDIVKTVPSKLSPYMNDLNVDYKDGELVRFASKEAAYGKEDFLALVGWTRQLLKSSIADQKEIQKDFLRFWHSLVLAPVQDLLSAYPNVIISSASELNYLPFEAFLNSNTEYFVEKHHVRYIPNTTVWKIIANRNYSENRKSVIAFGGANYQPSGSVKSTARGIEDLFKISDAVGNKISRGIYNFKPELEAVGFGGANYLTGTLKEVEFIGTLSNDIKVLTGSAMTESNFKKLNASGDLKQYKNLVISTHGFTGDVIPEFSGLMFTQPNGGDGNEDTFLLAPEIAKLNLNADLVAMSACDTGLGKLFGGEGINGLNTAFLVAGANANLLSLWPVDDEGTALTMQNLFKNIVQNKSDAAKTLTEIKRNFISGKAGETYKQPQFWAPFVYNGR